MIVAMQGTATEEQIQQVIERMVELGFNVHRTTGASQTILAGVGTPDHFEVAEFKVLSGVYDAYRISSPYKLAGRSFRPEGTKITFPNGVVVGGQQIIIMADSDQRETGEGCWRAVSAWWRVQAAQFAVQLPGHGSGRAEAAA
jgi:3-deoxy-7-phosphoheptulonate synthase